MRTLFLLPETWDLELDVSGNIAVANDVYQQAQDISSAGRTFTRDVYYNQEQGIPYFEHILGSKGFPLSLYKMYLENAALSVPNVTSVQAAVTVEPNRALGGAIMFTNDDGQSGSINL